MSTKPCCNDMKAYRIDFWSRILPANPVTNWIQVCEDHGSSIQVDSSKDDGLIEVNAKVTFILGRVDTCMFAATAALCQHTAPFSSEANDRSLYSVIRTVKSSTSHPPSERSYQKPASLLPQLLLIVPPLEAKGSVSLPCYHCLPVSRARKDSSEIKSGLSYRIL
jgi:hypothetical protein